MFGTLLTNLPEGVGIFGEISRKIFKLQIGVPARDLHTCSDPQEKELEAQLLILVADSNPKAVFDMRRQLDGISMCGIPVNAMRSMV